MAIVGFNFDKIFAEKKAPIKGEVQVKTNVSVNEVTETKLPIEKEVAGLKFDFTFEIKYEPKIGEISFKGHILYSEEAKKIKEIMDTWKKKKTIDKNIMQELLNLIIHACNIKALTYSQEVRLPPHLPMPRISPKQDVGSYIG